MHSDPRVRIRAAATMLAVVLAALLVACGDDKGGDKPSGAATAAPPDAATLLRQSAERMEQVKSFHFVLDHERGSSPIVLGLAMSRAEGDVLRPDRLRADIEASALGGVKVNTKLVSIGDTAHITNPFNPSRWEPLPSGTKLSDVFDPGNGTTAALRSVKDPRITGEETIAGKKVWRIEGDIDGAAVSALATIAEGGYTAKGTVWISQESRDVHRIRLDGPLGAKDTPGVIRRLELSRFDESVSITPVPSS